jgi:hypothetical protein
MAEIHINKDDIKSVVESYKSENNTFVIKSFIDNDKQKKCHCYINGKECSIVFYVKKNSVNIIPEGKNIDETNQLIRYIESKGFSTNIATNQFTIPCTNDVVDSLVKYINEDCNGLVSCSQNCNIYKFYGYNGDELTFTFYPQKNKAMIQGKPFHAYSIVISFLSGLSDYTFDQIVEMNNAFVDMNTPSASIRSDMQNKLGDVYSYLDEALLKSISGSMTLLKQKASSEDYTGCVTGEFKALEGYLKKILTQKFCYKLDRKNTFSMFHREKGSPSRIDADGQINDAAKSALIRLYSIYSNKRNVYLHSTVDPSQTRIIATLKEAQELSDEILQTINESYSIIFK